MRPINPIGNKDELTKRKYNAPNPPRPPVLDTIDTKAIQNKANKILTMLTIIITIFSFSTIFLDGFDIFYRLINKSFLEVISK